MVEAKGKRRPMIHTVTFAALEADASRIERVLRHHFGARDVYVTFTPVHDDLPLDPTQILSKVDGIRRRIVELLADGRAWKVNAVVQTLGSEADRAQVMAAIRYLVSKNVLSRASHGLYRLHGHTSPIEEVRPARKIAGVHGAASGIRQVLELLNTPKTLPQLRDALNVSRQAVDQKLKRLMEDGLVRRTDTDGA